MRRSAARVLTLGSTAVTSSTLVNAKAGQSLTFIITQDSTGGRAFMWPANVGRACAISTMPNVASTVTAVYDGAYANATQCTTSEAATLISGPTRSAPATPASGLACWFDGTGNTWKCKDRNGNLFASVLTASRPAGNQYLTYIDSDGVPHAAPIAETALSLTDVTTGNATISQHGFLPKLPGDGTKCLLGDGSYGTCPATPAGASGDIQKNGGGTFAAANANDLSAPVGCQAASGNGSAYSCSLAPAPSAYVA